LRLVDVFAARRRIAPYVRRTPLAQSPWLSDLAAADVALKLESSQVSNAFKARGAFNAVIALLERGQAAPTEIVTASAGNHGRGLAAAAETFHLPLIVFTPADAPKTKLAAIERHGAVLRAEAPDYDAAERMAKAFAAQSGAEFISAYSDPDVIAGAATVALEIFEDKPATDMLIVPIGGGGLISGMALVAKAINPACQVIGIELDVSCAFQTSVRAGKLVEIVAGPSLADGLGGNPDPETITFAYIQRLVDRIDTVSEADLAAAIAGLVAHEHVVAEGAGAAATAALVGRRTDARGRRVAAVVSGSNIDASRLAAVLALPPLAG
jgi:threonine dehydratase